MHGQARLGHDMLYRFLYRYGNTDISCSFLLLYPYTSASNVKPSSTIYQEVLKVNQQLLDKEKTESKTDSSYPLNHNQYPLTTFVP
jgi:hypothetical protein